MPAINIGNGLVEIGALTTLIGFNSAGDLSVGNEGSAGMVWGSITIFGNSSVIKACAGAALPGWLRYMIGLRTRAADDAVGMNLPLLGGRTRRFVQAVRSWESTGLLGVLSESDGIGDESGIRPLGPVQYRDILSFDRTMSVMLEGIVSTPAGHPLEIYMFHQYDCFPRHNVAFQLTALGLSLLKVAEIYYMFSHGGQEIGSLSAIPFAFSFIAAIVVEIQDIYASRRPMSTDGHVDIVVGSLPTTNQPGGPRKIVLGALKNPKTRIWWKAYYFINAVLQISSIFIYYQLFGQEQPTLVMTWAGFQIAWVTLRAFIFHFTSMSVPMIYRRMIKHELADLSAPMQLRVLNLVTAVGKSRIYLHPRAMENYKDDTFSAVQISKFFTFPHVHEIYELPETYAPGSSFQIEIIAVIGDTLLSGATWMAGLGLSPLDLYDSCIVFLSVLPQPGSLTRMRRVIAIPSARVFSVTPFADPSDSESRQPVFVPRGVGHRLTPGFKLEWIYWIPCSSGLWLHFWSEKQTILGRMDARIFGDKDITTMLAAGTLNISYRSVDDVKAAVDVSRQGAKCLLSFVGDSKSEM